MDRESRLGLDECSITKVVFTWNGENNTKSVGYEMKKKTTIPKTTGWCPLLWHFLPGNNIRPERKEITIIIVITIIIIMMIITVADWDSMGRIMIQTRARAF